MIMQIIKVLYFQQSIGSARVTKARLYFDKPTHIVDDDGTYAI